METRLDNEGCNGFCGDLLFPNHFVVKYPNAGGGLALLWKGDVQLDAVNYMANHILAKVVEGDGFVWFLSGFYGWPEASQKVMSWVLLQHLRSVVDGLWVCIGDFNVTLYKEAKQETATT